MSGNRIPSLINGSAGRPKKVVAGKKSMCRGCKSDIIKDEKCFDVPNPRSSFASSKRFCIVCFKRILEKTKEDTMSFELLL